MLLFAKDAATFFTRGVVSHFERLFAGWYELSGQISVDSDIIQTEVIDVLIDLTNLFTQIGLNLSAWKKAVNF